MECLIKQPKEKTIEQTYKHYQKNKQNNNKTTYHMT